MTEELTTPPPPTFFRFPDEATGIAALDAAGLVNEDGGYITASHFHCLDVIGPISRGGEWDEEGNVITPPEVLPGWHVNFIGEVPEAWLPYAVSPKSPVRRWL